MDSIFDHKIKILQEHGFNVDFCISESYFHVSKDDEDKGFYCSLYYGDSNGPWKPGTMSGAGYGENFKDSLDSAIENLQIVGNKKPLKMLMERLMEEANESK